MNLFAYIKKAIQRGNARFASLMKTYGFSSKNNEPNWKIVNKSLEENKALSILYIEKALIK